eukprot:CAMPEP_0198230456 /NCGR_PEP_ID=MMETSP1445-20131203/114672_1 /TAXON_ID=36898 /ORGANISM="Pyramimonas sp., Strain CCMP2087" /LENGTH=614 /DNA_ID=CAMNT_0043910999 /DNA_START=599 /DNA_END=2443 /DNA_ORIENTATION=-
MVGLKPEETDEWIAYIAMWAALVFSLLSGFFYAREFRMKRCGWEVMYVAILETINYVFLIGWGDLSPFYWKLDTTCHGEADDTNCWNDPLRDRKINEVPVARYMEWLITCPVLLIALSNLTGLKDDYNWRTMKLLTADQGTILFGATGAMATGAVKPVFFCVGATYGVVTYFTALEVYVESYANVPPNAKKTVSIMAYMFFLSWFCFPLFWLLGEEGFGHVNQHMSTCLHAVADLFSKNLWGLYSWYLRLQVREYHRKKWHEEQERLNHGEKEFEVPKERRPEMDGNAIATIFSGEAVEEEADVDPSYADYRRQRRRNRGRSLSEPDPVSAGFNILGVMDKQNRILQMEREAQEMKQMKMQQKIAQMNYQSNNGGYGMSMQDNNNNKMMGNNMQQGNPTFQRLNVVILDKMGFQASMLLSNKLEAEMGASCVTVSTKPEVFEQMQQAMAGGLAVDMVLAHDGMITANDAIMLHQQYRVAVVQFGPNMSPQQAFGEGYVKTPMPGQMFNPSELWLVVNKLRTKQLATANMPMGGGMMNTMSPQQSMNMTPQQSMNMTPQQSMNMTQQNLNYGAPQQNKQTSGQYGGQQPTDANGASVEVLMAEMNALKSYLSQNA